MFSTMDVVHGGYPMRDERGKEEEEIKRLRFRDKDWI